MDLASLDTTKPSEEGRDVHLRHPVTHEYLYGDDENPLTIKVKGTDSRAFAGWRYKLQMLRFELGDGDGPDAAAKVADAEVEMLANLTMGWSENWTLDGKALAFGVDNAKALYRRVPAIKEQVDRFMGVRANFLPEPATNSKPSPATSSS